ncbi:MAG TPA: multicopper oxidase domain-containing protein [Candidatus Binataceae bacterium]|nr:multicopper oxidase domain-containing protein [Candidatus Binataceae bacterium]
MGTTRIPGGILLLGLMMTLALPSVRADAADVCPRFAAGSVVSEPPDLFSRNGVLQVDLAYQTQTDSAGRTLYCFTTPDGKESPTLHIRPGDQLIVNVKNMLPPSAPMPGMEIAPSDVCGAPTMTPTSVNIHYHGTNVSPACHSDEVIHTMINSGDSFTYTIQFPTDEPPGLYWYHPHVHGIAEAAVQGGASGAIVVEGIEDLQAAVAGLRARTLVIRDNPVAGNPPPGGAIPSWDVSLNYVPIAYPEETPAIIKMHPGEREFWRVVNASADTIIDLQLQYDGRPQFLKVVGLDGVPIGSQDGTRQGHLINQTHILVPTAGRAEFIVIAPPPSVKNAAFLTLAIDTGPDGDNDPQRTLAKIQLVNRSSALAGLTMPKILGPANIQRFEGLRTATVTAKRTLYFSEVLSDPNDPSSPTNFFITVDGATPTLFSPNNPPAIVTTQGSVEDWTIQNRSLENHEFHLHQIHFLWLAKNGVPVSRDENQFFDMLQVPYWTGIGPYPSVTVRMDFRGPDIGDFVYHCHILGHEDNGMMAIIRVLPGPGATNHSNLAKPGPAVRKSAQATGAAGQIKAMLPGSQFAAVRRAG